MRTADHNIKPEELMDLDLIKANLSNREWRLNNLYFIKDPHGRKIQFKMNSIQKVLHDNMHYRNVIPKARKLGVSTFFCIFNLDQVLFSENKTAGIIAHRIEDQKRLFQNNILFAYENLHPWLKELIGKPRSDTANEIRFNNGGSIFVSLSTRGQTPQYLHISELGYICKHSPEKAEEIVSGAINSVYAGNFVSIESTAAGRSGHFYDITMSAERKRLSQEFLSPLDFKIHFFPWYEEPKYTIEMPEDSLLPTEALEYFKQMEKDSGVRLTRGQKWWYWKTRETNGESIFSEFPSTLEEAFSVSLEGAYYTKDINAVYAENRLGFFPVDPLYPVDVWWDLGMNDSTILIFVQSIGPEIRFVDHYENSGQGLDHYAKVLRERGYRYGRYILPHDVNVRDLSTGVSRLQTLWNLGLNNVQVAPKLSIADGISQVRMLFPRMRFDKAKAMPVLDALQSYRRDWDDRRGTWSDSPFHGPESHTADAVRTGAVMWNEGVSTGFTDEFGNVQSGIVTESFFG